MTNTASLPESDPVPGRSIGYMRWDGAWVPNTDDLPLRGTAAGGGYSTVRDLVKFADALEKGKLLPPALKEQATHPQTRSTGYGFGFAMNGQNRPVHWYGHGGGAPGMNADLRIVPRSGVVIATLANMDPPVANELAEFYLSRMPLD
jgi:CubicO group peptidase (beta-lactamase class C family)